MRISVIVPYKDRASYLPRTLSSIAAQTLRPSELVLVDNGSTDNSRQVCDDFAESGDAQFPVRFLSHPAGGASAARNAGAAFSTGDWLYFFDSDDEMSPDFLRDVTDLVNASPELDIVAAPTRMIFTNGSEKIRRTYHNASVADQILMGMLSTQGIVVRRAFFERGGGWNEALPKWNDWELGVRLLLSQPRIAWLSRAYHRIYQHPDSLTGTSVPATYALLRPAVDAVAALPLDEPARRALAARKIILAAELQRAGMRDEAASLLQGISPLGWREKFLAAYCHWVKRGGGLFYRTLLS
ncbi:MAG: glycosyltransferase family 2 protein [Alloprevotella sp.]|nr:glycosyltransferase family 2 protein [Alloprevotella sp.]